MIFSSDEEDDLPPPRERSQSNSQGFSDFCIKSLKHHVFGRREIELAEHVR